MHNFFIFLAALLLPTLASADGVQIPGPNGPLDAEMIVVPQAAHVLVIFTNFGTLI